MNDSLLMGMLHGLADSDEQLQPLRGSSGCFWSQILGDRHAADQLHHEVRAGPLSVVPASSTLAMFG